MPWYTSLNLPQIINLYLRFIFQIGIGQCWLPKFPLCIVGTYKGQTLCWYCWIHIIRENFDQTWLELVHSARNLFTSYQVFYYTITMEDISSVKAWIGNWKSLMQFYSAINWKNYTFYTSYAHWYKIQIYLLDQK